MNPALVALPSYPMAQLQARKAQVLAQGKALVDFGIGDPVEPTPSFIPAALKAAIPTISQYPSVAGTPQLRQAVAAYMARRFQVALDPERNILPSAGSKEAIFHLALAFLDASTGRNGVVFGTPGYPVYESSALFAGGKAVPVVLHRESGYRLDLAKLSLDTLQQTAIAWLNYPHNPTGACVDLGYLKDQAEIAAAHGILLASDECYQDLWFNNAPPPSLLQVSTKGVLVFHSCSKRSGMTGYRSGFIAGDAQLISTLRRWRVHFGVGSPAFVEAAGAAAWNDDQHVQERREIFSQKWHVLADGLTQHGLEVLPSHAGLYLWARVPAGFADAEAYAALCLDQGIVISPGGFFGPGGAGWFRLALVPTVSECRQAVAAWPRHQ